MSSPAKEAGERIWQMVCDEIEAAEKRGWERGRSGLSADGRTPTTGGEEDTARLDWLEANPDHVLDNLCEIWCCYPPDTEAPDNYQGGTVREAIDAARTTRSTGEE